MENVTINNSGFYSKEQLIQLALNHYHNGADYNFTETHQVSYVNKIRNEKKLKSLFSRLVSELDPYRNKAAHALSSQENAEMKIIITSFLLEIDQGQYLFDKPFIKFFIDKGYLEAAESFVKQAKYEDGQLTTAEVLQALRNVWIMNSLQIMFEIPLTLTPAIYAYSMLYPYTDNFLDNPSITLKEKNDFNHKLSQMLAGQKPISNSAHENRILELIGKIEAQYNREGYTQVYDSILLIQAAQIASLGQDKGSAMTSDDIMPISVFKGGASVLADAFLVQGQLSVKEIAFAFEYGAFLQLLDDLQDTLEDRNAGHQTIFSITATEAEMDENISRLIAYIFEVNTPDSDDSETMIFMKDIISSCSFLMIIDTVGKNQALVSKKLLQKLATYSKVRLSFYKNMETQLKELFAAFYL